MTTHQDHTPNTPSACAETREALEGWALGALEPDEMAAVDAHLRSCGTCRDEAGHWTSIAAMLPLSLRPVSPSTDAKRALMSRIADDQMATTPPSEALAPADGLVPAAPASAKPERRFHWAQLLVAPLAIALVVMTVWSFELQDQLDASGNDRVSALSAMLPEGFQALQMQSECEKCDTTGRLLADPQQAEALMVAWNLDPGEVHEVWCEEGDGSRALVANLEVDEAGEVVQSLAFDQPISGYSRIYVISQDGELVEVRVSDLLNEQSSPISASTEIH